MFRQILLLLLTFDIKNYYKLIKYNYSNIIKIFNISSKYFRIFVDILNRQNRFAPRINY